MTEHNLVLYLNTIEGELKSYITEYFSQLAGKTIQLDKGVSSLNELTNYILKEKNEKNEKSGADLILNIKKGLEFNTLLDIIIYFTHARSTEYPVFQYRILISSLYELKVFRNLIHHEKYVDDELTQRFFENVYFLFKYLKFPKQTLDIFTDFLKKDITMAIKCTMSINLKKTDSFTLEYSKINELYANTKKTEPKKIDADFDINQLNYIFENNVKTKLFEFNLKPIEMSGININMSNNEINYGGVNKNISYSSFDRKNDPGFTKDDILNSVRMNNTSNISHNFGVDNTSRDKLLQATVSISMDGDITFTQDKDKDNTKEIKQSKNLSISNNYEI